LKITYEKVEDGDLEQRHWIDGKPEWKPDGNKNWYGTDGGFPGSEFYSFDVWVDGKKWSFPRRHWQDCYEPGSIKGHLSVDGKHLEIRMDDASDGAGSYGMIWRLTKNGHVKRRYLIDH
jgi:hypothetical protein